MYELEKRRAEEKLVRSELEPVPGNFHLFEDGHGRLAPIEGKCCALSPSLIGLSARSGINGWVRACGVSVDWFDGAVEGFDDNIVDFVKKSPEWLDGYQWGHYMRRYVAPENL